MSYLIKKKETTGSVKKKFTAKVDLVFVLTQGDAYL